MFKGSFYLNCAFIIIIILWSNECYVHTPHTCAYTMKDHSTIALLYRSYDFNSFCVSLVISWIFDLMFLMTFAKQFKVRMIFTQMWFYLQYPLIYSCTVHKILSAWSLQAYGTFGVTYTVNNKSGWSKRRNSETVS